MTGTVLRVMTRLNRGGPLRQLEALVPNLARIGWTGSVAVGAVEPHESDGRADLARTGAPIHDVPGLQRGIRPLADRRALRHLTRLIERTRPDLVHTHLGKAGALGRLAASRCGVPVVHTLHGHHYTRRGWVGGVARAAERRLARHTTAWITLSESQREDLVAVVGADRRPHVHVVAPGFDVLSFSTIAMPESAAPVRLLWSGRHVPVKNVALLLSAFEQIDAPATLTLLGGGPGLAAVEERVGHLQRARDIHVQGEVDDPRPVIGDHHVVVLSSDSEGTPLALLEGMAAGRAVVATAVGGVRDIVTHGETGLLVPPRDAAALADTLTRVIDDPGLRSRLGAAAQEAVAARFDGVRLATDTAATYEAVLAAPRA